jgi:hypothetical protein
MESRFVIGHSRARHRSGGGPGSARFYHVYRPGMRDCIAREFLAHGVEGLHGRRLVKWEEAIYREGWRQGLPFPELVTAEGTTVTTELVGPSVRMLLERPDLPVPLTEQEAAALLIALLRASIPLADQGVMPFDGHLHNAWVWLDDGLQGGHVDFQRILFGDHTFTLARGIRLGRPLWCSSKMRHFPPEAKDFKHADEDAFARAVNRLGLHGATPGDIVRGIARTTDLQRQREMRWRLEKAYEEYEAPQRLQQALDDGAIEPHRMIQYSIGQCLRYMQKLCTLPAHTARALARCQGALERMADAQPERRFATLGEAADAVAACWGGSVLPECSIEHWPPVEPGFFIWEVRGGNDPDPASQMPGWERVRAEATFPLDVEPEEISGNTGKAAAEKTVLGGFAGLGVVLSGYRWLLARPILALAAFLLFVSLGASLREPQTPEQAHEHVRHAKLRRFIELTGATDQGTAGAAFRELKAVLDDDQSPDRTYLLSQIDERFRRLERRHLGRPMLPLSAAPAFTTPAERRRVARSLQLLADLGHATARKWLAVLQELEGHPEMAMR